MKLGTLILYFGEHFKDYRHGHDGYDLPWGGWGGENFGICKWPPAEIFSMIE